MTTITREYGITDGSDKCECHRCIHDKQLTVDMPPLGKIPLSSAKMILCGECGNQRCPKASDHDLSCTYSNDPGQEGSIYRDGTDITQRLNMAIIDLPAHFASEAPEDLLEDALAEILQLRRLGIHIEAIAANIDETSKRIRRATFIAVGILCALIFNGVMLFNSVMNV